MMRVLALVFLLLAAPVHATITWSCSRTFESVEQGYYLTIGSCTSGGAQTYTVGGDPLGATTAVADTAASLCSSPNRVLQFAFVGNVLLNSAATGSLETFFNLATRRLQVFFPTRNAGAADREGAEVTNGTNLGTLVIRFIAICT